MTVWLIVVVWCLGWLLAIRPTMRRTMLELACNQCQSTSSCSCALHAEIWRGEKPRRVAVGSLRGRTGSDVAWSVWIAAWWPAWLVIVAIRAVLRALGAGITRAVIRATPLTAPELERLLVEREQEIDRLTKQIGATPP